MGQGNGEEAILSRKAKPPVHYEQVATGHPVCFITQCSFLHLRLFFSRFAVFWEPVDPVRLGIPQYFDIIPRKDARDLRTIRSKLDTDKYDSVDAWEADMDLMIDNAIKFNGSESEVGQIAHRLRSKMREVVAPLRSSSGVGTPNRNKRPAPANGSHGPNGYSGANGDGTSPAQPHTKKLKLTVG